MLSGHHKDIEKGKERQPEARSLRAQMSGKAHGEQYQRMAEYSQQQAGRREQPTLPDPNLELRLGLPGTQTDARQQAGSSHDQIQRTVLEEPQQAPEHRSSSQQHLNINNEVATAATILESFLQSYRARISTPEREHTLQLQQEEIPLDKGTPSESDSGSEPSQTRKRKHDQTSYADEDPGRSQEVVGPSHQAEIGHEQPQDKKLSSEQIQSLDAFILFKKNPDNKKRPFNQDFPFTKENCDNVQNYIKENVSGDYQSKVIESFVFKVRSLDPVFKAKNQERQNKRRQDPLVKKMNAESKKRWYIKKKAKKAQVQSGEGPSQDQPKPSE